LMMLLLMCCAHCETQTAWQVDGQTQTTLQE